MVGVRICEMVPRDGLQTLNPQRLVSVETKMALIDAITAAGVTFIEVGSFVSPRAVPQMANTPDVCTALILRPGVEYAALVPNLKYYEMFARTNLTSVALFVSASELYSQFNLRQSIADSMVEAAKAAAAARKNGHRLRAHLSAVFHDIDGGDSDLDVAIDMTLRLVEMGCEHVALADTKGTTNPTRVRTVMREVSEAVDMSRLAIHLHDSYGMGIANALTAYECGVRIFDGSVGGLGGTPFKEHTKTPGGGGNLATEELVSMFERMGISTGVDLDALLKAGRIVTDILKTTGDPPSMSKLLR